MILQIKTKRGIQEIQTGDKNMDDVLSEMNIMNLQNYGITTYARYKILDYDAEIINGKFYIHSKHLHNKKILFDMLAVLNTLRKGIVLNQKSYETSLLEMLTISLENRLPTYREYAGICKESKI